MMNLQRNVGSSERGGALLTSLLVVAVLSIIATSGLVLNVSNKREVAAVGNRTRAMYMAETGLSEALVQVATAVKTGATVPQFIGTDNAPIRWDGGRYWCEVTPELDGTYTVTATGGANLAQRSIQASLSEIDDIYDHAIFAGNSEGDPTYALGLGGSGASADSIIGDVYSAGDVDVTGTASVTGDLSAGGTITGATGAQNVYRRLPDVRAMDYANNNDVDVAGLFSSATWQSSSLGGSAYELPEASPAHIFRKNPDDRTVETSSTTKDDFFLEDPHELVGDYTSAYNGMDGQTITLSGTMGEPGTSGTEKVYYIDGNLWVHNYMVGSIRFANTDAEGAKVVFVVSGNVYFSDDVEIGDTSKDAVAFIAIVDDNVDDSGNIYFGDPSFGTLDYMHSYMYAENTFYDNNLDASGSATVALHGNMTAGNKVSINRDYIDGGGAAAHSKLSLEFDDRLSTGAIELPGLPKPANTVEGFTVVYWREISVQ